LRRRLVDEDDPSSSSVGSSSGDGKGVDSSSELLDQPFQTVDFERGSENEEEVGSSSDVVSLDGSDEVAVGMVLGGREERETSAMERRGETTR